MSDETIEAHLKKLPKVNLDYELDVIDWLIQAQSLTFLNEWGAAEDRRVVRRLQQRKAYRAHQLPANASGANLGQHLVAQARELLASNKPLSETWLRDASRWYYDKH
jgi:hypothetical protein